jgi:hypothetical protein
MISDSYKIPQDTQPISDPLDITVGKTIRDINENAIVIKFLFSVARNLSFYFLKELFFHGLTFYGFKLPHWFTFVKCIFCVIPAEAGIQSRTRHLIQIFFRLDSGLRHKYFSSEKSSGHTSRRRAPVLQSGPSPTSRNDRDEKLYPFLIPNS